MQYLHSSLSAVFALALCLLSSITLSQSLDESSVDKDLEDASDNLFPPKISNIMGGSDIDELDKYPWFTYLLKEVNGRLQLGGCGATLVTKNFVLTAAHCLQPASTLKRYVWIGTLINYPRNGGQKQEYIEVEEEFIHPLYDGTEFTHDIALLKIVTPSTITPVGMDINGFSQRYEKEKKLTAIGLGCTHFSNDYKPVFPQVLQEVELKYVSNEECMRPPYLVPSGKITDDMMCATNFLKSICNGDSGGPLYDAENDILVGISSWGYKPFNDFRYPSVFSRISDQFSSWVKPTICSNSEDVPSFCENSSQENPVLSTLSPSSTTLSPSSSHSMNPSKSSSIQPSASPTFKPTLFFDDKIPSVSPTIPPSANTQVAPTSPGKTYSPTVCEMEYRFELMTDSYGGEISWEIVKYKTGKVAASSGDRKYVSNQSLVDSGCIQSTCYVFTIKDSFGDGLCCEHGSGHYKLFINDVMVGNGSKFQTEEMILFGKCQA